MKKIITITLALGLTSLLMAEANIPLDKKAMKAKVAKSQESQAHLTEMKISQKSIFLFQKIFHSQ